MTLTYSNPRMEAVIENWPSGSKRVTATFRVERDPKRGERGTRATTGAVKKTTYARMVRIVDGDDGKTYLLEHHGSHLTVRQSNMQFDQETIWHPDQRLSEMLELFKVGADA